MIFDVTFSVARAAGATVQPVYHVVRKATKTKLVMKSSKKNTANLDQSRKSYNYDLLFLKNPMDLAIIALIL